jgi:hypothetical protein
MILISINGSDEEAEFKIAFLILLFPLILTLTPGSQLPRLNTRFHTGNFQYLQSESVSPDPSEVKTTPPVSPDNLAGSGDAQFKSHYPLSRCPSEELAAPNIESSGSG